MHYIRTQRKQGFWVKFDGAHKTAPSMLHALPLVQRETLIEIYREHVLDAGLGSDNVFYDAEISELIAKEFAHRTSRRVPENVLVAVLTALRKRGLLPAIEHRDSDDDDDDQAFADIDKVPKFGG